MAEGFLRKYGGDEWEVHPLVIRVMGEVGIDISGNRPKNSRDYLGHLPVKHLVIVCNKALMTCPRIWPGSLSRSYLPFDDPAEFEGSEKEKLEEFRRVRGEIDEAMRRWTPDVIGLRGNQ
jgi:arsenate reductase